MATKRIKPSNSNLRKVNNKKASNDVKRGSISNPEKLYNQNKYDDSISRGTNKSFTGRR